MTDAVFTDADEATAPSLLGRAVTWAGTALLAVTWLSCALFGAYILAFYGGAMLDGTLERWNEPLPKLYSPDRPTATVGMGAHFVGGGLLLILAPLQLVATVRERWPAVHRWVGRVLVGACLLTGVGGLTFIVLQGTIGGTVMDLGFGLYGVLMLVAAVQTVRHARARRLELHRAWALRLFALIVGSWLYRIEYGFWFVFTDGAGHTAAFDGYFDRFMAFAFYLPNLALTELVLRLGGGEERGRAARVGVLVALVVATAFLCVGTYFFTRHVWAPEILARFE